MCEIVVFPIRPQPNNTRLRNALHRLARSVEIQREAIAEWRASLLRLQQAVQSLDDGMQTYQRRLDHANEGLSGLRNSALKLDSIVDAMLQRSRNISPAASP
jgi:hypothetical protein